MKKFFVFIVAMTSVAVLYFGNLHWKSINKTAAIESKKVAEKTQVREQQERQSLISSLDPKNHPQQSIMDFLHYEAIINGKVTMSVLGSNATSGAGASSSASRWTELLKRKIQSENSDLKSLKIFYHGYEGYSTSNFISSKKLDSVIQEQPDLVIFEDFMINNQLQSVPIEQTGKDLEMIMSSMKKGLPNSKIFIMSPNPIVNNDKKNSIGLTYLDYINSSREIIKKNNWAYIDTFGEIEKKLKDENLLLVDILANDYINLNDRGNWLWSEFLFNYLKKQ